MKQSTSIRQSIAISFFSSNSLTVLGILTSMVLGRLLKPAEIGTFVVVGGIIGIAHQFRDFGATNYIIQAKALTRQSLSRVFGLSILSAWSIGLVVLLASPLLKTFYKSDEMLVICQILALNFFLIPFGSNTLALLRRDMRFKERAVIDHVSSLVNMVSVISFALAGWGARALAWSLICATLATVATSMYFRPKQYQWGISFRGLRQIAQYGASVTASALLTSLNGSLVELISGRMLGLLTVGFFNKARSVTDMINTVLFGVAEQVALSVMANHHHKGGDVAPMYLRAVAVVTALAWPACAFAAMFPLPILHIMFGAQWDASAPMLRILCLLGMLMSLSSLWAYALFAIGQTHRVFKGELVMFVSTALILLAVLGAGLTTNLAWAVVAAAPIGQIYIYHQLKDALGFTHHTFLKICARNALVLLFSVTLPLFLLLTDSLPEHDLLRLAVAAPITAMGWLVGIFAVRHPLREELQVGVAWVKSKLAK